MAQRNSRVTRDIAISLIDVDRLPINTDGLSTAMALMVGVDMPPIHVQSTDGGRFKLLDGRHRLLAHKLNNRKTIKAKYSLLVRRTPS